MPMSDWAVGIDYDNPVVTVANAIPGVVQLDVQFRANNVSKQSRSYYHC